MSNLTIQQFIGYGKHPGIERLFGYSQDTWMKLLNHAAFTHILGVSKVPLVLFSQRVRTIANTRNNKIRRKHILSLLEYTESVNSAITKPRGEDYSMSPLTCWLSEVMGVLGFDIRTTGVTVRYVTRSNASNLAATTVGDSKHFISCLRSGVQRYVTKLLKEGTVTKSELTVRWYHTTIHRDKVLEGYSGCNSHYVKDEVKAFDNGKVFYAIVGNLVYEDHAGPRARARVHVVDDAKLGTMYVVDDVYGDELLVTDIYKDLHTSYPGHLYSTKGYCVPANVVTSSESVNLDSKIDVYSDHLPGVVYQVTNVTDFVPAIRLNLVKYMDEVRWQLLNSSKGELSVTPIRYRLESPAPSIPSDVYIDRMFDVLRSDRSIWDCGCSSNNVSVIVAAISKYYNLPYVKYTNTKTIHLLVQGHSRVVQSGITKLTWEIRGYTYDLEYDYIFESVTLTRRKCDNIMGTKHMYNLKTNKWVDTSSLNFGRERFTYDRQHNPNTPYSVTRHTIHLIYRLMPKPNARVRTMPKL